MEDSKYTQAFRKAMEDAQAKGIFPAPVGYLEHKPTHSHITVYEPISRFKALMMRWCFGLKYEKI